MSGDQGKTGTETGWRDWLGRNWVATLVGILGLLVAIIALIVQWPDDTPGTAGPRISVGGNNSGAIVTGDDVVTATKQSLSGADVDRIVNILTEKYQDGRRADQETVKSLRAAVAALSRRAAESDATSEFRDALEKLKAGDQNAAEAIYRRIIEEEEAGGQHGFIKAATAARHLGAFSYLHDTNSALKYYRKATELDAENPEGWNRLGFLLKRVRDLNGAIDAYKKILSMDKLKNDQQWTAIATGNLGLIYQARGELELAEGMQKHSLTIHRELNDKIGIAASLGNLGVIYEARGELDRAEKTQKLALAIHKELNDKVGMATNLGNIGVIYEKRGEIHEACRHWFRAVALFRQAGLEPLVRRVRGWITSSSCPFVE